MPEIRQRVDFEVGYAEALITPEPVEIGDRLVPPAIDVTFPGVDGQPRLTMRLEVVDGVPQCRKLTIESNDGGRGVRPLDLAAVRVADWVDDIYAMFARRIIKRHSSGAPAVTVSEASCERHMEAVRQFQDGRKGKAARKLDDTFLAGVAAVYRQHFGEGPTKAVAAAYGVGHRTASMYVTKARRRGLLPETTRGRKRA